MFKESPILYIAQCDHNRQFPYFLLSEYLLMMSFFCFRPIRMSEFSKKVEELHKDGNVKFAQEFGVRVELFSPITEGNIEFILYL